MDKTFEFVVDKDVEIGIGEHKWYGKEDRTEEKSIHDTGKGELVLIRLFEGIFPPTLEKPLTKEQILTPEYWKQIQIQLWSDGLRAVNDFETIFREGIRIDEKGFKVFVPTQATTGNSFLEEPKLLQEWTK